MYGRSVFTQRSRGPCYAPLHAQSCMKAALAQYNYCSARCRLLAGLPRGCRAREEAGWAELPTGGAPAQRACPSPARPLARLVPACKCTPGSPALATIPNPRAHRVAVLSSWSCPARHDSGMTLQSCGASTGLQLVQRSCGGPVAQPGRGRPLRTPSRPHHTPPHTYPPLKT